MVVRLVLAANTAYGPLFCFWDEPDNFLSLSEVGHFVLALRKAFQSAVNSSRPHTIPRRSAVSPMKPPSFFIATAILSQPGYVR